MLLFWDGMTIRLDAGFILSFKFKEAENWGKITTELSGQTLSIYLNGHLIASPNIFHTIQGALQVLRVVLQKKK
ncbi:hypothetical protein [Paenibacillus sp. LPE1-1-1.1]|uniref:hypothetical protein n=1 Tax=Paenibacillus sp. LPE1-1-1.1 TaxID=3135230 RepID=UPI0034380010